MCTRFMVESISGLKVCSQGPKGKVGSSVVRTEGGRRKNDTIVQVQFLPESDAPEASIRKRKYRSSSSGPSDQSNTLGRGKARGTDLYQEGIELQRAVLTTELGHRSY